MNNTDNTKSERAQAMATPTIEASSRFKGCSSISQYDVLSKLGEGTFGLEKTQSIKTWATVAETEVVTVRCTKRSRSVLEKSSRLRKFSCITRKMEYAESHVNPGA